MSMTRGGRQALEVQSGVASARGLLGSRPAPVVRVSPWMVADLYDPGLVITDDYVGRDRRSITRDLGPRPAAHRPLRIGQMLVVAVITAVAVVPLTLMASGGSSVATVRGVPVAGAATSRSVGPTSRASHAKAAAAARQQHRERAAARRASARTAVAGSPRVPNAARPSAATVAAVATGVPAGVRPAAGSVVCGTGTAASPVESARCQHRAAVEALRARRVAHRSGRVVHDRHPMTSEATMTS